MRARIRPCSKGGQIRRKGNMALSEPEITTDELRRLQHRRRMMVAGLAVLSLIPIAISAPLFSRYSLPGFVIFVGALLCLSAAVVIRVWSVLHVGGRKGRELVTSGPYALVRNPLYVGTLFGAFGVGLAFGSVTLAALLAVLTFLVFDWIIKIEERRLRAEFGAETFDAYLTSIHRWMPKLIKLPAMGRMETDGGVVVRTMVQALMFFLALAASHGLEALRVAGWFAPLIYLP